MDLLCFSARFFLEPCIAHGETIIASNIISFTTVTHFFWEYRSETFKPHPSFRFVWKLRTVTKRAASGNLCHTGFAPPSGASLHAKPVTWTFSTKNNRFRKTHFHNLNCAECSALVFPLLLLNGFHCFELHDYRWVTWDKFLNETVVGSVIARHLSFLRALGPAPSTASAKDL